MRKLITLSACAMLAFGSVAQTIELLPQNGTRNGGGVEVDVNNDGYIDLIYGGIGRNKQFVQDPDGNDVETERLTQMMVFNPATKLFELKTTTLFNADRAHFVAVDFNGDGNMDIMTAEHDRGIFYGGGIFEGKGDGTFEKKTLTFDDAGYSFRPIAVAAADFNNDAKVDIVAIGYENVNSVITYSSAVLLNNGNYSFKVTNKELLQEYNLALATVKVIDYNNDGFMDFFVSGNCDNKEANGGARVLADIFANLGADGPGEFYRLSLGDGVIFQKANGGLDIADFNADGWLDFAIHGEGGEGTGEPNGGDVWVCNSHLYMNLKNGSFADKAQPNFPKDIRPLNSSGTATRTIDWNGDGSFDLFIPGWNPAPESGTQAGYLLLNDGLGTFGAATRVPGGSEDFILFPDWNGDGKKDYFMNGQSWDDMFFATEEVKGRTLAVMNNPRTVVNERPTAPTNLQATYANNQITLSWAAATDKETPAAGLSYEYYIKDAEGKLINNCRSFIGGDKDGVRKVVDLGNAMMNKTLKIKDLVTGNYTWGVQAVDASYDGSLFATGAAFSVVRTGLENQLDKSIVIVSQANALTVQSDQLANIDIYTVSGIQISGAQNIYAHNCVLNNGVYLVKVTVDNQSVVRKVIVQ